MANPKEQTPAVPEEVAPPPPTVRPGLEPHLRKVVIFLAAAVAVLAIAVWMMFFIPKPACGILALLGGALAFAAMLHASRRNHGD